MAVHVLHSLYVVNIDLHFCKTLFVEYSVKYHCRILFFVSSFKRLYSDISVFVVIKERLVSSTLIRWDNLHFKKIIRAQKSVVVAAFKLISILHPNNGLTYQTIRHFLISNYTINVLYKRRYEFI